MTEHGYEKRETDYGRRSTRLRIRAYLFRNTSLRSGLLRQSRGLGRRVAQEQVLCDFYLAITLRWRLLPAGSDVR
jgi:hypothetical protein